MAAERPDVPFLLVDVEASGANRALAMEKALMRPSSQRRGAKPVLRDGAKFPAFSLHLAPALQPARMLTGSSAAKELAAALRDLPPNTPPSASPKVSALLSLCFCVGLQRSCVSQLLFAASIHLGVNVEGKLIRSLRI
jgi:hypothetical protein